MKRVPLIPTIIVALAVAAMIGLGVWQLARGHEKSALIARLATAARLPPVAFPAVPPPEAEAPLFRRSSVTCLEPVAWRVAAGRNRAGQSGWRRIADCRTGVEGPGATVDIGWTPTFEGTPKWRGGRVTGIIASAPDHRSLLARTFGQGVAPGLLLVADTAPAGLRPSAPPQSDEVPNNHLAYAVQWFVFAAIAAGIYALVLRKRAKTGAA